MIDLIERLNDSFLPMAIDYLFSHPEIILLAYLVLKGRDALFNKSTKPLKKPPVVHDDPIPTVYDSVGDGDSISPSQDEIDDHFGHHPK